MTLAEVKNLDCEVLTPAIVGGVIGCDPHNIRVAAHIDPLALGFPVIVVGSRVKIPKIPFIKFMEGEQ